jgi:parvulin-like peptidyl-prolyl isomerase
MIQKLLKDEFDKYTLKDISDADCKKYYDAHPEEFNKPEEARVSMILVKDGSTAKKVLGDARIKGVDNQGFRNLVQEYSIDQATKERGGDLRYFEQTTKEIPKEIVDASFKLQNIGDNSEPVKTSAGVAVLKLTGRRKALARSFDEVKEQIRNKLYRDKRQDAMESYGPGLPPPTAGQFHPGAPGAPQATPNGPGAPPSAPGISLPPPGSPKTPDPNMVSPGPPGH